MTFALLLLLGSLGCRGDADDSPSLGPDSGDTKGQDSRDSGSASETGPQDTAWYDPDAPSPMVFSGDVPRNLLFISVDTLQIRYIGRYHPRENSPWLDSFLEDAYRLEAHRSCSNWTFASFLCFQGGDYDLDMGIAPESSTHDFERAPDSMIQATEVLSDAGYWSAIVSGNDFYGPKFNTTQGADAVETIATPAPIPEIIAAAEPFLETLENKVEPWFFHIHLMDPHWPFDVPDNYLLELEDIDPIDWDLTQSQGCLALENEFPNLDADTQALVAQHLDIYYRASLRYMDDGLRAFWQDLETRGLTDDALVVFFTDHGEGLGEHGEFGHEVDLYMELTESIVALRAPGLEPGGWSGLTTHADIWPTIFALLDLDPGETFRGVPVGQRTDNGAVYALKLRGPAETEFLVERGDWRMLYQFNGEKALYDLANDPNEQLNVYASETPTVESLWELLSPRVQLVEKTRGYTAIGAGP